MVCGAVVGDGVLAGRSSLRLSTLSPHCYTTEVKSPLTMMYDANNTTHTSQACLNEAYC